jgi:ankyrin repeat protein
MNASSSTQSKQWIFGKFFSWIRDDDGRTVLHIAAYVGAIDVFNTVAEKKAGIFHIDSDGKTPLHFAAAGSAEAIVELILKEDPKQMFIADNTGMLPIHCAMIARNEDSRSGRMCLYHLLHAGADPNVLIISDASKAPRRSITYRESGSSVGLFKGSEKQSSHMARKGLATGDGVRRDPGFAPLHIAAVSRLENLAIILLLNGAKTSTATSPLGYSALTLAVDVDDVSMMKICLELGSPPNFRDRVGRVPLHFAKSAGAVEMLISFGGRPELATERFSNASDSKFVALHRKRFLDSVGNPVLGDRIALKSEWKEDSAADQCELCAAKFSFLKRKHHCRR